MSEIRVILRRPVTFTTRILASAAMVVAPTLDAAKDKSLSDISGMSWLILGVAVVGAVCNTISAWFSTGAGDARREINGKDHSENQNAPRPPL